jgi:hypothetical protein
MGTRRFLGAGGGVFDIDVPLAEPLQYQFDKGSLRLADGEQPFDEPEPEHIEPEHIEPELEQHDEPAPVDDVPVKPKQVAPKADWVAYAGSMSDLSVIEADAMTKAQLVERFG